MIISRKTEHNTLNIQKKKSQYMFSYPKKYIHFLRRTDFKTISYSSFHTAFQRSRLLK